MFKFLNFFTSHQTIIEAKEIETDNAMNLWSELFSCEGNTLIVTNPKENMTMFFDFLEKFPLHGKIFHKHDSLESLESILLHQKIVSQDEIEGIIPFVLVFDQCDALNESAEQYKEAILNSQKLFLRTITISNNCKSIPLEILKNIDTIMIFGKRKNVNKNQLKYLHNKVFKKAALPDDIEKGNSLLKWETFEEKVVKKVAFRKTIIISGCTGCGETGASQRSVNVKSVNFKQAKTEEIWDTKLTLH